MTDSAPNRECQRKDNRLLVLLVWGVLILTISNSREWTADKDFTTPYWLEIGTGKKTCYRFSGVSQLYRSSETREIMGRLQEGEMTAAAITESMKDDHAAAVYTGEDGTTRVGEPSPRLVFFLGQPLPINTAGKGELTLIPGIGPFLAENIMEYRQKHGRIDTRKELTAVRGIGTLRAEKLSPYITFE